MIRSPTALLVVAVMACSRQAATTPATVSLAEFKHLDYLNGSWKGSQEAGAPFFERYAYLNDSTIQSFSYQDSSFQVVTDSGRITWSGGQVRSGGPGASYLATFWSPDSVRFDPEIGVSNSFTWIRQSADAWIARLEVPGAASSPVRYSMTRVPR